MSAKDLKPVLQELRVQGWNVVRTTAGHWQAKPPDKDKEIVCLSASDEPRAIRNNLQRLRSNGFVWPPTSKKEARSGATLQLVTEPQQEPQEEIMTQPQAPVPPAPASTQQLTNTEESRMDALWKELRDAKAYYDLVDGEAAELQEQIDELLARKATLSVDRAAAADNMNKKKAEFDEAFRTEETPSKPRRGRPPLTQEQREQRQRGKLSTGT